MFQLDTAFPARQQIPFARAAVQLTVITALKLLQFLGKQSTTPALACRNILKKIKFACFARLNLGIAKIVPLQLA